MYTVSTAALWAGGIHTLAEQWFYLHLAVLSKHSITFGLNCVCGAVYSLYRWLQQLSGYYMDIMSAQIHLWLDI